MQIGTVRRPGEIGTQRLVQKYGDKLVAVRYRYDAEKKKRYKTVEIVVAEDDWQPPVSPPDDERPRHPTTRTFRPPAPVAVRIHYSERDLQSQIKNIGGKWDATRKLWIADRDKVVALGLHDRIAK
jgi:hypothetical protein